MIEKMVQHFLDAVGFINRLWVYKTLPKDFLFGRLPFKTEEASLGT